MTMTQTAMVLCVLGTSLLLIMPDKTSASDKFFQTGGRFGKRYDERISDIRFTDMLKTRSPDNVPPRIERGFYISRYGKRSADSEPEFFTVCYPSYGLYCENKGPFNTVRCKRIDPMECSELKHGAIEKNQLKADNYPIV